MEKEIKEYPEVNRLYKHYKGGKYKVISMAKHSEAKEIEKIIDELESICANTINAPFLLEKLKKIICDDVVVYKSITFGSVNVRPLHMWFENISQSDVEKRFQEIK
jgi:hypothetical protein